MGTHLPDAYSLVKKMINQRNAASPAVRTVPVT